MNRVQAGHQPGSFIRLSLTAAVSSPCYCCADNGIRQLQQLDVDTLRQFRATCEDGRLSEPKHLERLRSFPNSCRPTPYGASTL